MSNSDSRQKKEKSDIYKLFGSGTRVDVLTAFFTYPDEWLGERELERITGRRISDVQRNIYILWKIGLVELTVMSFQGGIHPEQFPAKMRKTDYVLRKPWRLNKKHPWVPALRMLLENALGSLHVLREEVAKLISIDVAFVYGSFTIAEQTPESDIDLIFIGHQTRRTLASDISRIERRINREIDFKSYTPEEWRHQYDDKNHFVRSLMSDPKIFLIGDNERLERITTG